MPRVRLRQVRAEDLPTLFRNQADQRSVRLAMVPARDRAAFDAHWKRVLADPTCLARAITLDGALAGHIGAWTRDGERQVGYWLGRSFWGQGVATRALRQLLRLEPYRPLKAHVAEANLASARVLEKCGFAFEAAAADQIELSPGKPVLFVDRIYTLKR